MFNHRLKILKHKEFYKILRHLFPLMDKECQNQSVSSTRASSAAVSILFLHAVTLDSEGKVEYCITGLCQ